MHSNRRRTFAALVSAGLLWGTTVPLSKLALHWLAPGWLTFVRFAVAAAILLPAAAPRGLRATFRPAVLASGALGYGGSVFVQNAGITRTSVTHAALLIGTVPVLVAIIAAVWHRTVARPVAWAGFALSLAGVGLVTGGRGGGASAAGDGLVLASLVLSAAFTVAQVRLLRGRDPIAITAVQFLGAALAVLPFAALTEGRPAVPGTAGAVLAIAALAVGGTLLPFALFAYGQSRVPAEVAGAFLNVEPLVGAVAGTVFFGNPAGPEQAAGGAAILTGIALSSLPLLAGGRAARRGSGNDPVPAAHEVTAGELVRLAPGLEAPLAGSAVATHASVSFSSRRSASAVRCSGVRADGDIVAASGLPVRGQPQAPATMTKRQRPAAAGYRVHARRRARVHRGTGLSPARRARGRTPGGTLRPPGRRG